jgi:hypothetical protein
VRFVPVIADPCLVDGSQLRFENNLVDGSLLGRETAADRQGASNIGRVVVQFATRIYQDEVAILESFAVPYIVQRAGVGTSADDGAVGNRRIVPAKFVQISSTVLTWTWPRAYSPWE